MSHRKFNDHQQALFHLVSRYEQMCQHESVFLKEDAYLKLVKYFEDEYLMNRALEAIEFALIQYPYSAEFYIRKAELLIAAQQETYAMAALDQAEMYAPSDLVISLLRSEALSSLQLYEDALVLLDSLKTGVSAQALSDIYLYESLVFEAMEEYERMFFALKASLSENPKNQEALERMWICVELSKRYRQSIILHEAILEEDPYSYLAWYNLGASHAYFANYSEAIEAYEYAFIINEKFEFAYRDCAEICFEVKDYQKALQCYQDVLRHFEPDQDIFLRIGQCYQNLGNHAIAKTFYEKAGQLDPYNDEVWFHIGECYAHNEQWKKAISYFMKAISIEDRREEYFAAIGNAYYHLGDFDRAAPLFRQATEIAPEQSEYWLQYASFLMDNDLLEKAIEVLKEADIYAVDTKFLYFRSVCLFQLGRRSEALSLLGDALYEDFDLHNAIFKVMPNLQHDTEVRAIIATYQPI